MKLVVVVPARNEEDNVPFFYGRARDALDSVPGLDWNIVFVNNASSDETLLRMNTLHREDPRVKVVTLSRNFGYHGALVAGLSSLDADLYAMVDVDCEDPPELLVDFFEAIRDEGVQLVYGHRANRDEPRLLTFGRYLFYLANRGVADSEIVMWMGEFSMMTKQVRDAILVPKTSFMSVRAEMGYVGFVRKAISYQRAKRTHGETHYNLPRMTFYAIASILSGTTFPLRLVSYIAVATAVVFPLLMVLIQPSVSELIAAATLACLFFLVTTIPLIGLYLARTYKNVVQRPLYIVDQSRSAL